MCCACVEGSFVVRLLFVGKFVWVEAQRVLNGICSTNASSYSILDSRISFSIYSAKLSNCPAWPWYIIYGILKCG